MKKYFYLIAFAGITLFSSCEKDSPEPAATPPLNDPADTTNNAATKTIYYYFQFNNATAWDELDSLTYTTSSGTTQRLLPNELPAYTLHNSNKLITISQLVHVGDTLQAGLFYYHTPDPQTGWYNGYSQVFISTVNDPMDIGIANMCNQSASCGDSYIVE